MLTVREPWGWHPSQIATLTDWQLEYEYLIPAEELAEQLESARKGNPPPPTRAEREAAEAEAAKPKTERKPPSRRYMVSVMTKMFGMSLDAANLEYDRQVAEWRKQTGQPAKE